MCQRNLKKKTDEMKKRKKNKEELVLLDSKSRMFKSGTDRLCSYFPLMALNQCISDVAQTYQLKSKVRSQKLSCLRAQYDQTDRILSHTCTAKQRVHECSSELLRFRVNTKSLYHPAELHIYFPSILFGRTQSCVDTMPRQRDITKELREPSTLRQVLVNSRATCQILQDKHCPVSSTSEQIIC